MTMAIERETESWQFRGACRDQDPEIYWPADDRRTPPDDIRCHRCVVQPQCLEWALANETEGVWGGTTAAQRRSLKRPRHKITCIACGSDEILEQARLETCLACGVSWPT